MNAWNNSPMVFLLRPVCPWPGCGSESFIACDSRPGGDGSRTRYKICRRCSRPVRFVIETPDDPHFGENVAWPVGESKS